MASEDTSYIKKLQNLEIENFEKFKKQLAELCEIWNSIGIDEEQKLSRANTFWLHLLNLGKDIVDEENHFYNDIKECVQNYEKKISDLLVELDLHNAEIKKSSLIEREGILRQELDKLKRLKINRIKQYNDLRTVESKLCKVLNMPELCISSTTGVVSEKDLTELEAHINMMKVEKEKRLQKFCSIKKELTTILEVTELTPETSVEKELLCNTENPSLSQDTFKVLEELMVKTVSKKAELEAEKKELTDKLLILWKRLKIDNSEREIFLSKHSDIRISNLNAFKQEIARCEEIQYQNMHQYIKNLKEELLVIWKKCFVSDTENIFPYFNTTEVNKNILEAFEKEIQKWKEYSRNIEHIILKIQKRQNLFNLLEDFENKCNDPNRFKNRRGNLLIEEHQRKCLQKELPNLETEIFNDIAKYEIEHKKTFLYLGTTFREYVTKQWDDRMEQKENKKAIRQKMRLKETPSKRRFVTTPKSVPNKLLISSPRAPIYRTPNTPSLKSKLPRTISKIKTTRNKLLRSGTIEQKGILENQNLNEQAGSSKELDCITYDEFASSLNQPIKNHLRSSVLASKKIVGTRIVCKQKCPNKSFCKSVTEKSNTHKMVTPVRGKSDDSNSTSSSKD